MNEVQMQELIEAIEKLSQKGWVDYLIIIVPIMLSVIAVWISLATAHKQNKIALFEKRYKALTRFEEIAEFGDFIDFLEHVVRDDMGELYVVNQQFEWLDHCYGTNLLHEKSIQEDEWDECDDVEWYSPVVRKSADLLLKEIESDVAILFFVANSKQEKSLRRMFSFFSSYVRTLTLDYAEDEKRQEFLEVCQTFRDEHIYDQLLKKIKI